MRHPHRSIAGVRKEPLFCDAWPSAAAMCSRRTDLLVIRECRSSVSARRSLKHGVAKGDELLIPLHISPGFRDLLESMPRAGESACHRGDGVGVATYSERTEDCVFETRRKQEAVQRGDNGVVGRHPVTQVEPGPFVVARLCSCDSMVLSHGEVFTAWGDLEGAALANRKASFVGLDLLPNLFGEVNIEQIRKPDQILCDVSKLSSNCNCDFGIRHGLMRLIGRHPLEDVQQLTSLCCEGHGEVLRRVILDPVTFLGEFTQEHGHRLNVEWLGRHVFSF